MTAGKTVKHSYTVSCASSFRDQVLELAQLRQVNVADLARSVMILVPTQLIDDAPDPGEPLRDDRETVVLKSGPSKDKPWQRKPRLQIRMTPGHNVPRIRKALNLALAIEAGDMTLKVLRSDIETKIEPPPQPQPQPVDNSGVPVDRRRRDPAAEAQATQAKEELTRSQDELERLRTIVSMMAFDPLASGVTNRADALYVLGFSPAARPNAKSVRARYRMLAAIHHPDSGYGSHQRMSQINAAMDVLRNFN